MDPHPTPFERRRRSAWQAGADRDPLGLDSLRIVAKGYAAILIIVVIYVILFGRMYLDQTHELTEARIQLASERAVNQQLIQQLQQQKTQQRSPATSTPAQR